MERVRKRFNNPCSIIVEYVMHIGFLEEKHFFLRIRERSMLYIHSFHIQASIEFLVVWSFYKVVVVFWSFHSFHSFLSRTSLINDGFNVRAKKRRRRFLLFFWMVVVVVWCMRWGGKRPRCKVVVRRVGLYVYSYVLALHYTGLS